MTITGGQVLGRARSALTRDPVEMELFATAGVAFVRVGAHTRLHGSRAQCLALYGDTVYVGCRGGGLKRSPDRGDSFGELPLPEPAVFSVAVSAADGAVYAGTEPSRLFRSRDGGESWEELVALQEIPSRADFPPGRGLRTCAGSHRARMIATLPVGAGGLVFVPRGTAHTVSNPGDVPVRALTLISPGDAEHELVPVDAR